MAIMTFGPKHSLHKKARVEEHSSTPLEAKIVYLDKIVEVPVEVIREVSTVVEKEVIKYIEVPIETIVERVVEVVKEVPVEVIVERLIEVPVEKIKEVPSFVDRIVVKHTQSIPKYVLVLLGIETVTLVVLISKIILGG